ADGATQRTDGMQSRQTCRLTSSGAAPRNSHGTTSRARYGHSGSADGRPPSPGPGAVPASGGLSPRARVGQNGPPGRGRAPPPRRRRPEWVAGASPRPRRPLATRTASAGRAVTLRAVTLRAVTLRAVTLRAVTLRAVTLRAPRELAVPRPTRRRW